MKFRVVDNLEEKVMAEFLSWVRYSEYEGDLAVLYLAKNEAINEHQRRRNKGRDSDDSDDVDLQDVFKGTSMNAINIENETRVWLRIAKLATESLKKYDTTLQEDNEILEKDDKEKTLTYNERNCILYRHGEKIILDFLLTCSDRFIKIFSMT